MDNSTLRRRCATLLITASLLGGVPAAAGSPPPPAHWAEKAVTSLRESIGWGAAADLNQPITPAEWNAMVASAVGVEPGHAEVTQDPARYWVWFYTASLSKGETVSRQLGAAGLVKLLTGLYGKAVTPGADLSRFRDARAIAADQRPLVADAVQMGLLQGYPTGELRPDAPLTHGEAATLVQRFMQLKSEAEKGPGGRTAARPERGLSHRAGTARRDGGPV